MNASMGIDDFKCFVQEEHEDSEDDNLMNLYNDLNK